MGKYREFLPTSADVVKQCFDSKLGEIAREFHDMLQADGHIKPKLFAYGKPYLSAIPELPPKKFKNSVSKKIWEYYNDTILSYLGLEESAYIKADTLTAQPDTQELLFRNSRIPTIFKKPIDYNRNVDPWHSGVFHMDSGFRLEQYKFIIYASDIKPGNGGTVFPDPIITPYSKNGTPNWRYKNGIIQSDIPMTDVRDVKLKEVVGPKGTTLCFNCHLAHAGRVPLHGERKAIHLVLNGPPAKPYEFDKYYSNKL
jgi:hypothetical protein